MEMFFLKINRNRSSTALPDEYYFTTCRKNNQGINDENVHKPKRKSASKAKSKAKKIIKNNGNNNSTSHIDHSAEEIKESDIKPYNFISDKTKNEILNKMKNKEKYNSNWFNESESSSLSYSKVFNASGRDYGKNVGISSKFTTLSHILSLCLRHRKRKRTIQRK